MGIDVSAKQIVDMAFKVLSSGTPVEQPGAIALPQHAPDPEAVNAFRQAMDSGHPLVEKTGQGSAVQGENRLHFPGDLDQATGSGKGSLSAPALDRDDKGPAEGYIKTVTDIFRKEDLSHLDLFKVQVLSSVAHVEITRNSSITKSLDDNMKTIIKSSS